MELTAAAWQSCKGVIYCRPAHDLRRATRKLPEPLSLIPTAPAVPYLSAAQAHFKRICQSLHVRGAALRCAGYLGKRYTTPRNTSLWHFPCQGRRACEYAVTSAHPL